MPAGSRRERCLVNVAPGRALSTEPPHRGMISQIARLRGVHGEEFCLVRSVAGASLTVQIYSALNPGEQVEVEIADGPVWAATVVSQRDSIAVLHGDIVPIAARAAPLAPRPARIDLQHGARIRIAGVQSVAVLCNISQGGAKIRAASLEKGLKVILLAGGLPPLAGRIRWVEGDAGGLSFYTALDFDLLARWTASVVRHAA